MRSSFAALVATVLLVPSTPAVASPDGYGKRPDGFTVGPRLSLVSFPTPSVGIEAKAADLFGASLDYGLVPQVSVEHVRLQLTDWRAGAKVYPFRGRFFLGVACGRRTLAVRKTVTDSGVTESGKLEVTSVYLAPELGWRFVWQSGFFLGLDLGWQFVLRSSSTLETSAGLSSSDRQDLDDVAKRIGKVGLPELGLLQVGWFL